jgi:DnaJ family protein A protein 5
MQEENIELGLDEEPDGLGSEEPPTPVNDHSGPALSDNDELQGSYTTKKSKKKKKKARGIAVNLEPAESQAPTGYKTDDISKPMQDLKMESQGTSEDEDKEEVDKPADGGQKAGEKPALTKREKRRAKDAAKKAREAEAPPTIQVCTMLDGLIIEINTTRQSCNVCAETFESRTKLFAHIEASGHQLAVPEKGPASQNTKSGAKKGKSKGKR